MERRILVIEDDAETGQLIASHLGEHGFTVKVEHACAMRPRVISIW